MPLPRRCKKCRCYVAPQLQRCPRCTTAAPSAIVVKPTKEDKQVALAKRDAKVPVIHAKHIHWTPSAFALHTQTDMVEELKRRLGKADTPRLRNTIRSELRIVNATLARAKIPDGKKAWTNEMFHTKHQCISVFISPTKHRYVLADKDGPADLIVISRKKRRSIPVIRLARFEKTRFGREVKKERREDVTHKKRRLVQKKARAEKKKRVVAP